MRDPSRSWFGLPGPLCSDTPRPFLYNRQDIIMYLPSLLPFTILLTSLSRPIHSTPSHLQSISLPPTLQTPNFHLTFTQHRPYQTLPLWGVSNTLYEGIQAAREHGLDEPLPPQGFRAASEGVRLHAYPIFREYTWGLMAFTLRQVDAEMEMKGTWACQWELVEVGGRGRIWGRGTLEREVEGA
ncbi:hypothetical protein XPA_010286 [Xanthoria parietina]